MRTAEDPKNLGGQAAQKSKFTGLDRFLDEITDTWFPNRSDKLKCSLCFSFAGSATFVVAFFAYEAPKTWAARQIDPKLLNPELLYPLVLVPVALWFAFLTAYRSTKPSPSKLYLSGFLLPAFVWSIINSVFVG